MVGRRWFPLGKTYFQLSGLLFSCLGITKTLYKSACSFLWKAGGISTLWWGGSLTPWMIWMMDLKLSLFQNKFSHIQIHWIIYIFIYIYKANFVIDDVYALLPFFVELWKLPILFILPSKCIRWTQIFHRPSWVSGPKPEWFLTKRDVMFATGWPGGTVDVCTIHIIYKYGIFTYV